MKSQLAKKAAGDGAPAEPSAAAKSKLASLLSFARGLEVELPLIGRAWVVVASHAVHADVEVAVNRRMKELDLELGPFTVHVWESERTCQTLARCVRTTEDHDTPVGSADEWSHLVDAHTLVKCWRAYGDVCDIVAPLDGPLDDETKNLIVDALKKKDPTVLRSCGAAALATYLLSMEHPPASSPTPTSSAGESSAES